MSQIYKRLTSGGPIPGNIATSYTTDVKTVEGVVTASGSAIPSSNILDVLGRDTGDDNDNGIRTNADPNLDNNLYIELTNRVTNQQTTAGAAPSLTNIFPLGATPGVYTFWGKVTAFNTTSTLGASWDIDATVRTTGAAGVEIAVEVKNARIEGTMSNCSVTAGVNANFFTITLTGYVDGVTNQSINWDLLFEYRKVT